MTEARGHTRNEQTRPLSRLVAERSVSSDSPILYPLATPRQQIEACRLTLQNFIRLTEDDGKRERLSRLTQITESALQIPIDQISEALARKIVVTTVGLLDIDFIDEIKSFKALHAEEPGTSYYAREIFRVGERELPGIDLPYISQCRFMTSSEFDASLVHIEELRATNRNKQTYFVSSVDEFTNLKGKIGAFVFTKPLSQTELEMIKTDPRFNNSDIFIPIQLTTEYGGFVVTSTRKDFDEEILPELGLRSQIPRHEIWQGVLESGKSLAESSLREGSIPEKPQTVLDATAQTVENNLKGFFTLIKGDSRLSRSKKRRLLIMVNKMERTQLESLLIKHEAHYNALLSGGRTHPHYGEPQTLLTRSGVSANEAAIRGIAAFLQEQGQEGLTGIDNGFYYENIAIIDDLIPRPARVSKMPIRERILQIPNVLFLNYEPNRPQGENFGEKAAYDADRETAIKTTLSKARREPEKPYFIFVDKTGDPLYASFQPEDLPSNVMIIETVSLTKHQRGERNFAFGAITVWGNSNLIQKIQTAITASHGELTPWGITHLPRITKEEIQLTIMKFTELGQAFKKQLEEMQAVLPKEMQWRVYPYNYFLFIEPPERYFWGDQLYRLFGSQRKDDLEFAEEYTMFPLDFVDDIPNTARGDSFGLNETRVTRMPEPTWNDLVNIIRISYGMTATPEQIQELARALGERIISSMNSFQELKPTTVAERALAWIPGLKKRP